MRGKLVWGVVAVVGLGACGGDKQADVNAIVLNWKNTDTVTVTAGCSATNQVDVAVDKWEIYMKRKGTVEFVLQPTGGASLELVQKTDDLWPFDEKPRSKATAKAR